jgi:Ca2+-binding RTX toxin-like protein
VYGYPGNTPCLDYRHVPHPVRVDLAAERARAEGHDAVFGFRCVYGSRYSDVLIGADTRDGLDAGGGSDLVIAGAGNDSVSGGNGNDRLYLGDGADYANGDAGDDRLYGDGGSDVLEGWTQRDYIEGGTGDDQIYGAIFCAIGGNSYDTGGALDGAPDELFGGDGSDYLVGDKGNDRIDGGTGYDWAQPGLHDGRIDWVENIEDYVNGCLENVDMNQPLHPQQVRDVKPW